MLSRCLVGSGGQARKASGGPAFLSPGAWAASWNHGWGAVLATPARQLFGQPQRLACPAPKNLAPRLGEGQTLEFLMGLAVPRPGFPLLIYWLMDPPFLRLEHGEV